ncbi:hypothetical protein AALB53_18075 [Lachnospiraceae bacterium 47-T17]
MNWEDERMKRYQFKNIYQSHVLNIEKIHPLQQRNVINIVNIVEDLDINKIIVIGSALNLRCNPWSDLDLVVCGDLDGMYRACAEMKILSVIEGCVDILWMQDIKDTNRIIKDIERGVVVYEQTS